MASYWKAALEAHRAGDYNKTMDNLDHVLRNDNEFTSRAQPWMLVITAGTAQGFMDLADGFEMAARANRSNPGSLRKRVSLARASASEAAMQFADVFQKFIRASKDSEIAFVFDYPTGTTAQPPQLKKVLTGGVLVDAEFEPARRASLQRGVLLTICRAVGAPNDSAKALALFRQGEVKLPRDVFVRAMAESLYEQSQLFRSNKLDQPDRARLFSQLSLDALKTVAPDKATKTLEKKIQDDLKKLKATQA